MSDGTTPASVEGLYEQLACQRAGRARAVLARQVSGSGADVLVSVAFPRQGIKKLDPQYAKLEKLS